MTNTRISLGVAFLSKRLNDSASAKAIIHAEFVTATGKYLLSKITYQYNSDLMLDAKTKEIECANIVDVLQRLSKAVEHRIQQGYAFDASALEVMSEDDEDWGSFELGTGSSDPELDTEGSTITMEKVLTPVKLARQKRATLQGERRTPLAAKLRLKRAFQDRMAVSSLRVR